MVEKSSKTAISKWKNSERKPKSELESKIFRDGAIYLFKRADYVKPTWFCRVKIPNTKGYISQSTKTTDEHLSVSTIPSTASKSESDRILREFVAVVNKIQNGEVVLLVISG